MFNWGLVKAREEALIDCRGFEGAKMPNDDSHHTFSKTICFGNEQTIERECDRKGEEKF